MRVTGNKGTCVAAEQYRSRPRDWCILPMCGGVRELSDIRMRLVPIL